MTRRLKDDAPGTLRLAEKPTSGGSHLSVDGREHLMRHGAKSIRAFIGAKDFAVSRSFYNDLGFTEHVVSPVMSYFSTDGLGFYLQHAYVKDWLDNTMLFMEVDDVERHWTEVTSLQLPSRYEGVRLSPIRTEHWGREYFLHDPSGILWHFGEFAQ
jgi:catechol 2,3-dioxygenase-like lactoylglutathione lyase family enzyme